MTHIIIDYLQHKEAKLINQGRTYTANRELAYKKTNI